MHGAFAVRLHDVDTSLPVTTGRGRRGELRALLLPSVIALAIWPLSGWLAAANIVMLFLLGVLVIAYYCNRRAGVIAAVLSVALFDFLYVPPRFSFAVNDIQYLSAATPRDGSSARNGNTHPPMQASTWQRMPRSAAAAAIGPTGSTTPWA